MKLFMWNMWVFLIFLISIANAAEVTHVRVQVGKVTEVVLPEKAAKVIKGGAVDSVLVEVLGNSVYVLPKTQKPADIFITGVSGKAYPLSFVLASEHDVRVELGGTFVERELGYNPNVVMDLMKDVLLGRVPAGAKVVRKSQAVLVSERKIQMNLDVIYEFMDIAVYIFKANNLTQETVAVPLEALSLGHLLAITSDADILNPKGKHGESTKVYMIISRGLS